MTIKWALGHMTSCKDVSQFVSRMQDEPLSSWQRFRLRLHLAVCDKCARFAEQVRFLREAMQKYRE